MRRALGVAATSVILLGLGTTSATSLPVGVGVGHRLQVRDPTVRAGQVEPFREVAKNDGPSPIQVTVFGVITFPCADGATSTRWPRSWRRAGGLRTGTSSSGPCPAARVSTR